MGKHSGSGSSRVRGRGGRGRGGRVRGGVVAGAFLVTLVGCGSDDGADTSSAGSTDSAGSVVVTHAVLGAVVSDLVGDAAEVRVLMPNGTDPHEWEPSAKDLEAVNEASVVVANGLHLEESLDDALATAADDGVVVFEAGEHVTVRTIGEGEMPAEHGDEHAEDEHAEDTATDEHAEDEHAEDEHADHGEGADDPHLWMDPLAMRDVVVALAPVLAEAGIDVTDNAEALAADLEALSGEVEAILADVPAEDRQLVSGHESLGYFADRYDFTLVGAVIPSISSQAEAAAGDLAELKEAIDAAGVTTIFTELGTPDSVVQAIADEAGVGVVELGTHLVPADGTYRTFMLDIANAIATGLAA